MFLVKYIGEIIKWLSKLIFKKSIDHIDSQNLILTININPLILILVILVHYTTH